MISIISLLSFATFTAAQTANAPDGSSTLPPACTDENLSVYHPASISRLISCFEYAGQIAEANGGELGSDWQLLCENAACRAVADLELAVPSCSIERKTATSIQKIPITTFFQTYEQKCVQTAGRSTKSPATGPQTGTDTATGPEAENTPQEDGSLADGTSGAGRIIPTLMVLATPFLFL